MDERIKRVWHDPVWSKVIATVIVGIPSGAWFWSRSHFSSDAHTAFAAAWTSVSRYWEWLTAPAVPRVLLFGSLLIVTGFGVYAIKLRRALRASQERLKQTTRKPLSSAPSKPAEELVDLGMAEVWTPGEAAVMRLLAVRSLTAKYIPAPMIVDELHPKPRIEIERALSNLQGRGWVAYGSGGVYLTEDGISFAVHRKWHEPLNVDPNEKPVTDDEQRMMRMLGAAYEVTPVMPMGRLAGVLGFKRLTADHVAAQLRQRHWLMSSGDDDVTLTDAGREVIYKRHWDDPKMPD